MILDFALMVRNIITNLLKQNMHLMVTIHNLRVKVRKTKIYHFKDISKKCRYFFGELFSELKE